jgi:DNA gyrase subunit A
LFITNLGKVYQSKVYELPMAGRTSLGKAIVNLLNFEQGEKLATVLTVPEFVEDRYVVMATKLGRVKKTDLMAYSRPRSGGLIGIKLADDDELIAAGITDGETEIFLGSEGGKVIRFDENDVRTTARGSMGVRGMRIDPGSCVGGMEVLNHGRTLLTVTENGYGKRTLIPEYRSQTRGGKGVFSIRTSERNGKMVALLLVEDEDELMLVTDGGKLIRTGIQDISVISRNTQGVKLINLSPGEKLIGAARLPEEEEDEEEKEESEASEGSGEDFADSQDDPDEFDAGESHGSDPTLSQDDESDDNGPRKEAPEDDESE